MGDIAERLDALFEQVAEDCLGQADIDREIRALLNLADDPYRREKLTSALSWSIIYFSDSHWQQFGTRAEVKAMLLSEIRSAKF